MGAFIWSSGLAVGAACERTGSGLKVVALVNGTPGAVWAPGGRLRVVFTFAIAREETVEVELLADPARLGQLDPGLTVPYSLVRAYR